MKNPAPGIKERSLMQSYNFINHFRNFDITHIFCFIFFTFQNKTINNIIFSNWTTLGNIF